MKKLVLETSVVSALSVLVFGAVALVPASADETTYSSSGVGFKGANKFAPKYKERIRTYKDQIQMGLTKGWLTQAQADQFSAELVRLGELDAKCEKEGYVQPGVDDLDKQFTKFNMEFSRAGSTPAPAAKPATTTTTSTTTTTAPAAKAPAAKTTAKTTTKATSTKTTTTKKTK
ncbi:MAG: hypothetical protein U0105_26710 [Candidatus Obscuribacterales bacterium]